MNLKLPQWVHTAGVSKMMTYIVFLPRLYEKPRPSILPFVLAQWMMSGNTVQNVNFVGGGGDIGLLFYQIKPSSWGEKWNFFELSLFQLYALCIDRYIHCHLGTQHLMCHITLLLNVLEVTNMKEVFYAKPCKDDHEQ